MYFKKSLILIFLALLFFTSSCGAYKKVDQRQLPDTAKGKARKNVDEGRGAGLGGLLKGGGTNYEFSTSNPIWRASLETLDFLPMNTVDYSGGIIITDWYSEKGSSKESIKITVRFLSNEIRSDSVKIVVHKRICDNSSNCVVNLLTNSLIQNELQSTIIKKAALLDKLDKNKKKK
jgi:hypothetical protein